MVRNPVLFAVEVVAVLTTILFARDLMAGGPDLLFSGQIVLWLWFTLIFANAAEALAEGPRQGPGRQLAAHPHRDDRQTPDRSRREPRHRDRAGASLRVGDVVRWRPANSSPRTAR